MFVCPPWLVFFPFHSSLQSFLAFSVPLDRPCMEGPFLGPHALAKVRSQGTTAHHTNVTCS